MPSLATCLWFDDRALEAAEHYAAVLPDTTVVSVSRYGPGGPQPEDTPLMVELVLVGQPVQLLNGGPAHTLTEAVSMSLTCADQAEADLYWNVLADGGTEGRCGWLRDRFDLWWQIVPQGLGDLIGDPDRGRALRALDEMMTQSRLDLVAIRRAADGG